MTTTIKNELAKHILDYVNDGILTDDNKDEWHFHCFNEDYYIIYHSNAIEWLKKHNIDTFEAIEIVRGYEIDLFGEFTTNINPESIVNMLVYIYGEELLSNLDANNIEELVNELETI